MVDDARLFQVLLAKILSKEDCEVTCASDGQQALELMAKGKFDLVITDVMLPGGMNGVELLQTVKRNCPECPVIVMSGDDSSETAAWALKLGATAFMPKPFNADLIRSTVARALKTKPLRV